MSLLHSRRFLPLFLTQFLGAFNDNLFKNALIILIIYRIIPRGDQAQMLVTLAAGIFILPFFLVSATAGQVADKFDRARIARLVKIAEVFIMLVAIAGFYWNSMWLLMLVLFLMGTQSAFFGPVKYAILPQHLTENELLSGNAYVEAATFVAILIGTILGGVLILAENGKLWLSAILLTASIAGYFASRAIPTAAPPEPTLRINSNFWQEMWRIIGFAQSDRRVFSCILGISWFWLLGATYLSQFPAYVRDTLHASAGVVTLLLALFSIGIASGSWLCNRILKGLMQSTYVPLAALGMTLFGVDLYFASHAWTEQLITLSALEFAQQVSAWRVMFDLFSIAACAGVYVVPLYAMMQHRSAVMHRARIIAANNIMNALFVVFAALITLAMLYAKFTVPDIFLMAALTNGLVVIYIARLLPGALIRSCVRMLFSKIYRVQFNGVENYAKAGKRILIISNHISLLDPALIAAYLPRRATFAINTHIAKRWWIRPLLSLVEAVPLDPTNPLSVKSLIDLLKADRTCVIFPEGRITTTGSLMKIYEGTGMIADKSGATLLPIHIDGAQYTPLSYLSGKVRTLWRPRITLTILPPVKFTVPETIQGKQRRRVAALKLYDVMLHMAFSTSHYHAPLLASLRDAVTRHGKKHLIVEDLERKPLGYGKFLTRCFVLGRLFNRALSKEHTVGLLLPNAISTMVTFFGLHTCGKTPALLNFSAGSAQLINACKAANIHAVITARHFIKIAKLEMVIQELERSGISVLYLEECRDQLSFSDRLLGFAAAHAPSIMQCDPMVSPDAPAVVLFTSGSEGTPKGVVLSHANLQANVQQIASSINLTSHDKLFNCLPMFHAFGLTGGTLLPLMLGIPAFYYPSPLHYRAIPELIYDTSTTLFFSTDTFLAKYARFANPYDFHSMRYVFSGAEKLKKSTQEVYAEQFGIRILEGYGVTETAPVISMNTPMHHRAGTVGRLMPGMQYQIKPVPGITEGGKLLVKGPNVMLGYLHIKNPGELQSPSGGWHDTGDVVTLDDEGYLTIQGRIKRFAKIGGEMISLAIVEMAASALWQDNLHAALVLPDYTKNEKIILLTTQHQAVRNDLVRYFKKHGISMLALPQEICYYTDIPLLGSGKIDYLRATQIVHEKLLAAENTTFEPSNDRVQPAVILTP